MESLLKENIIVFYGAAVILAILFTYSVGKESLFPWTNTILKCSVCILFMTTYFILVYTCPDKVLPSNIPKIEPHNKYVLGVYLFLMAYTLGSLHTLIVRYKFQKKG